MQDTLKQSPTLYSSSYDPITKKTSYSTTANPLYQATSIPKTSTTTQTNANIIENVKPALDKILSTYTNKGSIVGADGVKRYADGSLVETPSTETVATTSIYDTTEEDKQAKDIMDTMQETSDASTKELIDNIKQKFAVRRQQQQEINRGQAAGVKSALLMAGTGAQGGASRYAPISSEGVVSTQERYGIQELAELDAAENDAIAAAKAAQALNDYKLLEAKLSEVEEKRAAKIEAAQKLNESIAKANEEAKAKAIESTRDSAIADLYSQGITDVPTLMTELTNAGISTTASEISAALKNIVPAGLDDLVKTLRTSGAPEATIQKVLSSTDMNQAYKNAGAWASTGGSGTVAEYNLYKAQAIDAGQTPVDFNTYQNMDANRKAKATTSGVATVEPTLTEEQKQDPFIKKLLATAGGKPLTDTSVQKIDKALTTLGQIGVLQENIKNVKTGPISGLFKGKNPWDTNAQAIKAQLNAIVPNLARGVYGEVGVLTDNDIKNYSKTLPTLTSTEDVRNAVLGITIDMIAKSLKNTLEVNAANKKDVSGYIDIYTNMLETKDSILSQIPGYKGTTTNKTSDQLIQQEKDAETALKTYITKNPTKKTEIQTLIDKMEKALGRSVNASDFLERYPQYK
jgi:hypothetical protein